MSEAVIIQLLILVGVVVTALPAYFKILKPMRDENSRDHAKVQEGLEDLRAGQAAATAWREQHDLRHEDLQDRLHALSQDR